MEFINRIEFAEIIYKKINDNKTLLSKQFEISKEAIGYVFLDDLLPKEMAIELHKVFPEKEDMLLKKSIKEDKFVAVQMNLYNPLLEEIIYAFQDSKIVGLIGEICQVEDPIPDEFLYAGGLSMMGNKQFLNPHLDNSHDKERERWRVLNLLYYITPDWKEEYGGNLELWPNGLQKNQITIHSKFNRLVIMLTHNKSLHSVSPVVYNGFRCCISNYYFSKKPVFATDRFHVTSFRGRPEHRFIDAILKIDTFLRMSVRKVFKKGIRENPHVYKK
jgi:Rps23 Pro-64 3,4-dihydroxylase Tpa1-like proline 4-hydroxylase